MTAGGGAALAADLPADQATDADAVAAVRAEIAALRETFEARLAELEHRLDALTGGAAEAAPVAAAEPDLAALRQAALEAAGQATPVATAPATPAPAAVGGERNLSRLNPEVSFTGIVLARSADDGRDEFALQEFELDLQSALDPFSRARWTVAFSDEGVDVEEGYVNYNSLPTGLDLLAGRFRQRFGAVNRQHLHALPQNEYPLPIVAYFGDEGLAQTGVSLTWLRRLPWASANELTLELTDGENEAAFAGESFEDLAFLLHLKNYWDVNAATYLEWGLSGVTGRTATGGDSSIYGTDMTYHWQPPSRAKYRELTWRTELLASRREDELGIERHAWGAYTYVEGLLTQNLYAGVRLERAEEPLDPGHRRRGIVPYLTWWQSEFVRLRAEYDRLQDELADETANRFSLQIAWAAGPHKHETY